MTKHRLMLSAAAAALLAAAWTGSAAQADTTITTATTAALDTATAGNITINQGGGVGANLASAAAVTINSNNSILNQGYISNSGTTGGIGLWINTTAGNIQSGGTGFASTGTIELAGAGTSKTGILISGGNRFSGPISLTTLDVTASGITASSSASSVLIKGDYSSALYLAQGTTADSNILISGGIIQNASDKSEVSSGVMVNIDGTLNGTLLNKASMSGTGPGMRGVQLYGGIHACATASGLPAGFTCPTISTGAFVNSGSISVAGTVTPSTRGSNPESGSAVLIGNGIEGGFLNNGPGTSSGTVESVIFSNGLNTSPTIWIDPSLSGTALSPNPRGPIVIGPVDASVDSIDPGFSFINRGAIQAQPVDSELSATTMVIQGSSLVNFTCLGVLTGVGGTCNAASTNGGLLNTGTIAAQATTSKQTVTNNRPVTATGLYIGDFATIPRINVTAETISGTTVTSSKISAAVQGVGQGRAFAILINQNANVPEINVSRGAEISASVLTETVSPSASVATSTAPFTLQSEAIVDNSSTLQRINNAGRIQATNTILTPAAGAYVTTIQRAIDLQASSYTATGVTINNKGQILGDVLLPSVSNGGTVNVGNVTGAPASSVSGVVNTPANYAVIADSIISQVSGQAPVTKAGLLDFGADPNAQLNIGAYGYVNADIRSIASGLDVTVENNGILYVANSGTSLQADQFNINANGTLGLSIAQSNTSSVTPVVQANTVDISGANLALQFGGFISSGFTAASTASPTAQTITLIRAPVITDTTLPNQNALLSQNIPFLFESPSEAGYSGSQPLSTGTSGGQKTLLLTLIPRSTGAKNADGTAGLNLSGEALQVFPYAAGALSTDSELGAAVARNMTVYNTPGVPSSGINIAASQQAAQQTFAQFSPDVSGGVREVAIMITDQASGPVAARQRLLRAFSGEAGDMTLWGEEFAGHINNKGRTNGAGTLTSYKDHGWGFVMGVDGGSPRNGWYGAAFTFYTGDVSQVQPRLTRTETQWYMLTGYTNWKGKNVFLDTQLSLGYGNLSGDRGINIGGVARDALSKRATQMVAAGGNTGVMLKYAGFHIDPHISLDGLTLREEGYTETEGGPGFNLQVAPYYANSLRTALGADFRTGVTIWGIELAPEARIGYRYELLNQPVKIKAAFASTGGLGTVGNTMTFIGPDPGRGNVILGLGFGASTDTWQLGVKYDWIRGDNRSTTQVGTFTVLGRI